MFDQSVDDRLSSWASIRQRLDNDLSAGELQAVWDFWRGAPFVPFNPAVDPYHKYSWPTPWQIIVDNRYDDFTKALMIGWTLKLTDKFAKINVELRTLIDITETRQYNIVCVDDVWVINYSDDGPETLDKLPSSFRLENLIELDRPR